MKQLFLLLTACLALTACGEKKPEDKASDLIEKWMSENYPNVQYKTTHLFIPIRFTEMEQKVIDDLKLEFEKLEGYETINLREIEELEGIELAWRDAMENRFGGLIEQINEMTKEAFYQKMQQMYKDVKAIEKKYAPKMKGEKGYTKTIGYNEAGKEMQITFTFNPKVSAIATTTFWTEDEAELSKFPNWDKYEQLVKDAERRRQR